MRRCLFVHMSVTERNKLLIITDYMGGGLSPMTFLFPSSHDKPVPGVDDTTHFHSCSYEVVVANGFFNCVKPFRLSSNVSLSSYVPLKFHFARECNMSHVFLHACPKNDSCLYLTLFMRYLSMLAILRIPIFVFLSVHEALIILRINHMYAASVFLSTHPAKSYSSRPMLF